TGSPRSRTGREMRTGARGRGFSSAAANPAPTSTEQLVHLSLLGTRPATSRGVFFLARSFRPLAGRKERGPDGRPGWPRAGQSETACRGAASAPAGVSARKKLARARAVAAAIPDWIHQTGA